MIANPIEINISINNNEIYDISLDTLYSGWAIGAYSCISMADHCITGIAKTDCSVIIISRGILTSLTKEYDEINHSIRQLEESIKINGLPFLDYRMYRTKTSNMTAKQKFRIGVRRIVKIVRSYKIDDFQGLLTAHKTMLKKQRELNHASTMRDKQQQQLQIIKDETSMTNMKINTILDIVSKQSDQINSLQKEIKKLRNQLDGKSNTALPRPMTRREEEKGTSSSESSLGSGSSSVLSDREYATKKKLYDSKRINKSLLKPQNQKKKKPKEDSQRGLDFTDLVKRKAKDGPFRSQMVKSTSKHIKENVIKRMVSCGVTLYSWVILRKIQRRRGISCLVQTMKVSQTPPKKRMKQK